MKCRSIIILKKINSWYTCKDTRQKLRGYCRKSTLIESLFIFKLQNQVFLVRITKSKVHIVRP